MVESIVLSILIIAAFAAVRVMRGGLGWQPPRWLMAVMAPAIVFGLSFNPYVAASAALLSAQFVSGYSDLDKDGIKGWEDPFWDLGLRCLPAIFFVALCFLYKHLGLFDFNYLLVNACLVIVIISNMMQTKTRQFFVGRWPWPDHSNRLGGEIPEGAALGALVVATVYPF